MRVRTWWTQDDLALTAIDATCTGTMLNNIYQSASQISGYDKPEEAERNETLDCFPHST